MIEVTLFALKCEEFQFAVLLCDECHIGLGLAGGDVGEIGAVAHTFICGIRLTIELVSP